MQLDCQSACALLRQADNIVILSHQKPDGDTLGSAFALLRALEAMGKTARVECSDGYPARYRFIFGDYRPKSFEPGFIVTVDVANTGLLGELEPVYGGRLDLCIDHHKSNTVPARHTLVDPGEPATALIIFDLIEALGVPLDKKMADALFTGISTDTGCFLYDSVTARTHRVAARLIDLGAEHGMINRLMFESKSRGRLEIDKLTMNNLEFHYGERCALITIPNDVTDRLGVSEEELDGIASFPRKIEGIVAGITLREKQDGTYRVSLRTGGGLDASKICTEFGGGGHAGAAGCTLPGPYETAKKTILAAVGRALERVGA